MSETIDNSDYIDWEVITACELNASAAEVWYLVGGFYNIHHWCPDIETSVVQEGQGEDRNIRREIAFPNQPLAWEELEFMDNKNMLYKYKWYKGAWGESVQKYHSQIQVVETELGKKCILKWSAKFFHDSDAITGFYHNGFNFLIEKFGGKIIT